MNCSVQYGCRNTIIYIYIYIYIVKFYCICLFQLLLYTYIYIYSTPAGHSVQVVQILNIDIFGMSPHVSYCACSFCSSKTIHFFTFIYIKKLAGTVISVFSSAVYIHGKGYPVVPICLTFLYLVSVVIGSSET